MVLLEFAPHFVVERHLVAAHGTPVGGIERREPPDGRENP